MAPTENGSVGRKRGRRHLTCGRTLTSLMLLVSGVSTVTSFVAFPSARQHDDFRTVRRPSSGSDEIQEQQDNGSQSQNSSENPPSVAVVTFSSQEQPPSPQPLLAKSKRAIKGVAARTGPLNLEVARIANTTLELANELIDVGAVWARMDTLSEDDVLSQYDEWDSTSGGGSSSATASILYSDMGRKQSADTADEEEEDDLDDYIERMMAQRYRRILSASTVEAGTDIRVYPSPRRFPSCYDMNPESLLYEDTTFLVVDKPPMLPTQPDASNYFECVPGCANDALGSFTTIAGKAVLRPLLCHRVDACVGGCVVLSKDRNGQKVFHELQRKRQLKKVYLAVTTNPVPLGMHLHWMWAPQTTRRGRTGGPPCQLVSHSPPDSRRKARQFWTRCALEVVKCEPIVVRADPEKHTYNPDPTVPHYQATIRLVTGRKHQVRAQLASLGCPIIRDTLYGPMGGYTFESLQEDEEGMDRAVQQCRIPITPIGLQAHAILFGGVRAKARTPWWGDNVIEATGV